MDPGSVPKHGAVADRAAATWVGPTKDIRCCISRSIETLDHSAALATNLGVFGDHRTAVGAERTYLQVLELNDFEQLDLIASEVMGSL